MSKINSKLKCSFFLMLLSLVFVACSKNDSDFIVSQESDDINTIVNAKLIDIENSQEIEVTTDYIKDKWEKALKEEGFNVKLDKFQILETVDETDQSTLYFLKTTSTDGTIQTGAFIYKTEKDGVYKLGGKTCTCEGCPTGCELQVNGTKCSCSSCPGPNRSCTKTETILIDPD